MFSVLLDLLIVLTGAYRYVQCSVRFTDGVYVCILECVVYC
jgi:hypothetical protein